MTDTACRPDSAPAPRLVGSGLTIAAALCGGLASTIPSMIVASSLNEIATALGTTTRFLGWAISAPLLASAVALPALGRLADRFGHRRLFLTGMTLVAVLSAATTLAPNGELFVTGRILTQVAGVAAQPAAVAMLRGAVSFDRRAAVFSAWGFMMSAGPALGLVVGGLLVDVAGWQATFVMQSLFALCSVALALAAPAPRRDLDNPSESPPPFDAIGACLMGLGALSALIAIDRGFSAGWTDRTTVVALGGAVLLGATLWDVERRRPFPLIPPRLSRLRSFRASISALFCMQALVIGTVALVPVLLRGELGFTASATSMIVVFVPIGFGVAAPLGGHLAQAHPRLLIVAGAVGMAAAMCLLAVASRQRLTVVVVVALLVLGAGAGLGRTVYALVVTEAGAPRDIGIAVSLERLMGQIGGSFGVAMMLGIATRGSDGDSVAVAALAGCGFAVGAVIVAAWWLELHSIHTIAPDERAVTPLPT